MSVKRDPWGRGKRNISSRCSCSSRLASHVYPDPICSDGSSSGQFRVHLFRSYLLFTVNHVTSNPIPVQRITYITIHRWKVTIPVQELISLLACLGKQQLMLCKSLSSFPCPGQGEAGLALIHWCIQERYLLSPARSTWEERGIVDDWCENVTCCQPPKNHAVVLQPLTMCQNDSIWSERTKTALLLPLTLGCLCQNTSCHNIGIYEVFHLSFIYLI